MAAAAAPLAVKKKRPAGAVPRHIAVIMDGNRRFGRERFADPLKGHEEGGRVSSTTRKTAAIVVHGHQMTV